MKSHILASILLAMLFAASPLSASADSFHETAIQARAKYVAAQESWQRDLAELTIRANPNFREIATVQRDLQLAYIEEHTARFRYLLEHDASRIVLTNGVFRFANPEWTDTDTKALIKTDPANGLLEERITTLEKKNDQEPDWPKFRAWFHDRFSKGSDYKNLLTDFQAKQKEVEDLLGRYKP